MIRHEPPLTYDPPLTFDADRLIGLTREEGRAEYHRQRAQLEARRMAERVIEQHLQLEGLEELTGAKLEHKPDPERPGFRLDWGDGDFVQCHRNGTWLHFDYLTSLTGQSRLTHLVSVLPCYFRKLGITHFSTTASGANDAMLRVGFQWHGNYLLHDISEGCRMDQWAAWKRGEKDEPEWHRNLGERDG